MTVLIGGLAVAGCVMLVARAVVAGVESYGRRDVWVRPGAFAILLLLVAIVCWVVASATADPDNPFAMLFIRLRGLAYLAGAGLGIYALWQWR